MDIIRFDKTEFEVLDAASHGCYSLDETVGDRAEILMSEGIFETNPRNNWWYSGWKLTPEGEKYHEQFMVLMREKHGHVWMTHHDTYPDMYDGNDEYDNEINRFAYESGYHNGMVCKKCGFSFCVHCDSEFDLEECPKKNK